MNRPLSCQVRLLLPLLLSCLSPAHGGWDCRPAADGRGWDCRPAGEERVELPSPTPPKATEARPAAVAQPRTAPSKAPPSKPPHVPPPRPATPEEVRQADRPTPSTGRAVTSPTAEDERGATPQPPEVAPPPAEPAPTAKEPTTGQAQRPEEAAPPPDDGATPEPEPTPRVEAPTTAKDQPSGAAAPEPAATAATASEANAEPQGASDAPSSPPADRPAAFPDDWPSLDEGMAWGQCALTQLPPAATAPAGTPLVAQAQAMEWEAGGDRIALEGKVHLAEPGTEVLAEDLLYDRRHGELVSQGPLRIQRPRMSLQARSGRYRLDAREGRLDGVEYRLRQPRARGEAAVAELLGPQLSRFENPSFTTCPPGNDGFRLEAKEMTLDRQTMVGTFEDAKLRFLGVPIFYSPWLSIPLSDERRSGLLVPSVGFSSSNGLDLALPYYFNLAPNYDLTATARLLSKRGLLLAGEFRFLLPRHRGTLLAEILPEDREYDGRDPRGAFRARTRSHLAADLNAEIDLNWVSDDQYLEDLGRSLAVASTRHLRNRAALIWRHADWDLLAELLHYDTLDQTIAQSDRPYSILPRLRLGWHQLHPGELPLAWDLNAELVHFQREESITGQRVDIEPLLRLPIRRQWYFIEPLVGLRYTAYNLDDQEPGRDPNPDRLTWRASLDGGLFFERPVTLFDQALTHTLEPRAFYNYVSYQNQDDIPLFDTNLLDFTFDNLFRGNRFNGPDRVGDANQLTLALTSRLLRQADGRELLRASIGQIYYFDELEVRLDPDDPPWDHGSSSLIAELGTELFRGWLLRAAVQVDPNHSGEKLRQGLAQATWRGDAGEHLHASWRLRQDILEETDLAAIWPVSQNLKLIGRWYYSVEENHTLEAVAGLEYGSCCWRLRALARHYLDGADQNYNDSLLLQLELNGLGRLGNDIDHFLDRTIYGY